MSKDDPVRRSRGTAPLIDEGEIFGELAERRGTSLFLGRYSLAEVMAVLYGKGFFKEARKRGLWPLEFDLDSSAYPLQRFRIFLKAKDPERVIIDLKIRETLFDPAGRDLPGFPARPIRTLNFEWLTLQNPKAEFSELHGALPGQQHPGLGMSRRIMQIFIFLGKRTHQEALLAFPAFYHNAVLFSRYFKFIRPEKEGEVAVIRRTFSHMPIRQLAWIVHLGCLRDAGGRPYEWQSEEQIAPLCDDIAAYLEARAYRERVKEAMRGAEFTVDWEAYEAKAQSD